MKRKNVLIIHTDQQRADSIGCMGNGHARTPNIDRLAESGTLFTRHIAANPICSPSRASLLTGQYVPGHNLWCNGVPLQRKEYLNYNGNALPSDGWGIASEPATMADMFASAGYRTASFGKLHLTPWKAPEFHNFPEAIANLAKGQFDEWFGPYYGFEHVELTYGHGPQPCGLGKYAQWLKREHPDAWTVANKPPQTRPEPLFGDLYEHELPYELHNSNWLAERFDDYVKNRPTDQPFFVFIGFPDPHHPFTPCREIAQLFMDADVHSPVDAAGDGVRNSPVLNICQRRLSSDEQEKLHWVLRFTYAMIHQIDLAVGRILKTLDDAGLSDDTIVIFTSDHGDFQGDHGLLYKGYGASNSLLHVPFVMRAPGSGLPGRVDLPMSNCDLLPTLAALTGVAGPEKVDGTDIIPVVRQDGEHYVFAHSSSGDPKSVNFTVYDQQHRLTYYPWHDFVELFDHEVDPEESRNVAGEKQYGETSRRLVNKIYINLAKTHNPILNRLGGW